MLPLPPRSTRTCTLFPYTTPVRSERRPRRRGQQNQAGHVAGTGRDPWRHHRALAVAQHVHARRVDAGRFAQRGDGKHGVVGGLAVDGDAAVGVVLWARLRALVVAQHRDALCGEAARDVEEGLVRADALVAVVWTGAVHQPDRGHAGVNIGVLRPRTPAGPGAFAAPDGAVGFAVAGPGAHGG